MPLVKFSFGKSPFENTIAKIPNTHEKIIWSFEEYIGPKTLTLCSNVCLGKTEKLVYQTLSDVGLPNGKSDLINLEENQIF